MTSAPSALRAPTRTGFTLVELLVAAVAAAILALTAGAMLYYGYIGWRRTSQSVEMQRDATVALDMIARAVRRGTNVTVSGGTTLTVRSADRAPAQFYASGTSLFCDPNINAGGDQFAVVPGRLSAFSAALSGNKVVVVLALQSGGDATSNRVEITRRN